MLVILLVLVDILLLIYYNNMGDYSKWVPHLAKLGGSIYLISCLENLIVSINIGDQ